MEVMFQDLITSIGVSVQEARRAIEDAAMELYFQGYEKDSADQPVYTPIQRRIRLPLGTASGKILEVPVTALYHHNVMELDSVTVKLKFLPCGVSQGNEKKDLLLDIKSPENEEEPELPYSELSLSFQSASAPEGMARVNEHSLKPLP